MEKLVRDNIPQIMRAEGKSPETRIASEAEYKSFLFQKLSEECSELAAAASPAEAAAETADVLEVLDALMDCTGLRKEEIDRLKAAKKEERGGFSRRIILDMKG